MPGEPLLLTRFFYGETVTLGALELPDRRLVYTCEDGWVDNQQGVSCIPDGLYRVIPRRYNKGGYAAWEITGVPGRSLILIHKGNKADDVTGCVVPGTSLWAIREGLLGVASSGVAFKEMHRQLDRFAEWWLRILPLAGLPGTGD